MNDAPTPHGPQDGATPRVDATDGDAAGADHPDSAPTTPHPDAPFPGSQPQTGSAPDRSTQEDMVWVGRTSWKHFATSITLWLAGSVLLAWLMGSWASASEGLTGTIAFLIAAVPIALAGLFVAGRALLNVYGTRYRLTTERLFIDRGILSQTIDQTELIRVDDVRVRKSAMDRIFSLGTVEILSTDTTDRSLTIVGISQAESVAESIRDAMRKLRKKSVFVESL